MPRSPLSLWLLWMTLAVEAQTVIWLRLMRIAAGGAAAEAECARMVSEKSAAALAAGSDAMLAAMAGRTAEAIARTTLAGYRRQVRANRRRLTR